MDKMAALYPLNKIKSILLTFNWSVFHIRGICRRDRHYVDDTSALSDCFSDSMFSDLAEKEMIMVIKTMDVT